MAFYDTVESIKQALDGYSEDESRLLAVYEQAAADNQNRLNQAKTSLENDYRNERNRAYSDIARDERNVMAFLAERGLGFSGEAAQAKLNSNVMLNNRYSQLASDKSTKVRELENDYADKNQTLSLDYINKLSALNSDKNNLSLNLAELEQKNEQSEADRAWEKERFESQQKADAEALAQKKAQSAAELAWEKEKLESQLKADAEALAQKNAQSAAEIAWEKEKLESQLKADAEALDKKLQAEREMQNAELYAKYYYETQSGSSSGNTDTGSNGSGEIDGTLDDFMNGYMPDIKPKDLAKLMVNNATDGNFINDAKGEYLINKYLVDMIDSYRIDEDYLTELVFMLKAYGYKENDIGTMRKNVITYEAKEYYDVRYRSYFDRYLQSGIDEASARSNAKTAAKFDRFEFIRQNTSTYKDFYDVCVANGIPESDINSYASRYVWSDQGSGSDKASSGAVNAVGTRVNMLF